ncbi:MAG: RluA family pseudouridine synthase [Clostridia bacterium]|nr:RluA family pseudouridine synthase [Clostridia bacterium]
MRFENEFAGLSIKQVLTDRLGFSKRAITALKSRSDGILLNGAHATVRALVREGDVLEINCKDEAQGGEKLVPSCVLPDIIYEDEIIVAANKPPFMPTHQSQGHFYDTLANSLAYYYKQSGRPFVFRSVNRLDRNTSGIVLVAKDKVSCAKLSDQMKNDGIRKSYIAILDGTLPQDDGIIETYIRRKDRSIILREVCERCEDAKIAVTRYRVLARSEGLSLVLAMPLTGRTHQLRVHFSHLGAPILGDDLYGRASELIDRHALHAYSLSFEHPYKGEKMEITADIPEDMKKIVDERFGKEGFGNGRTENK